jgi:hypothetical protein
VVMDFVPLVGNKAHDQSTSGTPVRGHTPPRRHPRAKAHPNLRP